MISPILNHKLKSSAVIIAFTTLLGTCLELLSNGFVSILGPAIGLTLGVPLAAFEEFVFPKRMRTYSFTRTVIAKTAAYLGSITLIYLSFAFFVGWLALGKNLEDFVNEVIYESETYKEIGTVGLFYSVAIFFMQLNKLLGPGVLLNYVRGRYHAPKIEQRVFMFLDLKSSTSIAENLGHFGYYSFLNDFIRDS